MADPSYYSTEEYVREQTTLMYSDLHTEERLTEGILKRKLDNWDCDD